MKSLTGTGALLRLIVRRDRLIAPIWIVILTLLPIGTASAFAGLYPTEASRESIALTFGSAPALVAILGHIYDSSIGGLTAWRVSFVMVAVALFGMFTVIRHTRAEEEAGRRELLGSAVVGRQASLTAALLFVFIVLVTLGSTLSIGLIAVGLPVKGSLTYGLTIIAVGALFACVSGLAAQLTEGSGNAKGLVGLFIGAAFVIRMIGDAGEQRDLDWVAWLSPLGWAERIRPFSDQLYWILLLFFGLSVVSLFLAYTFSSRRDIGAGLLPARLGPPAAPGHLSSSFGLAWRLHRRALFAWCGGLAVFGGVIGGVAETTTDIFTQTPQLQEYIEQFGGATAIAESYLFATASIMAIIISAYAVQSALKAHGEEVNLRAEPLLATAVGRVRWAAGHLAFALGGPALVLAVFALVAGATYGLTTGNFASSLFGFLPVAFAFLPAVWILTGVAFALFGLFPKGATLSWFVLAFFFVVGQLGEILEFDERILDISPFTHVPNLYLEGATLSGPGWMLAISLLLIGMGLAGLKNRDIAG